MFGGYTWKGKENTKIQKTSKSSTNYKTSQKQNSATFGGVVKCKACRQNISRHDVVVGL